MDLKYTLTPPDTQLGRDLLENVRQGIISQSSFAFTIAPDKDAQKWQKSSERGLNTSARSTTLIICLMFLQ